MLSRRHLREKVMQALFAHFGADNEGTSAGETYLMRSIDKVYDLYVWQLLFLIEVLDIARERIDEGKKKHLPTGDDLNPNLRFVENPVLLHIEANTQLRKEREKRKLSWADQRELIRKIFNQLRESAEYAEYMAAPEAGIKAHRGIVMHLYGAYILNNEVLLSLYEESNMQSVTDAEQVALMIEKTVSSAKADDVPSKPLVSLFKEPTEDQQFVKDLFHRTIIRHDENLKLIKAHTSNWETERIAGTDLLMMEMAITEFMTLREVPPKVTMNEYIEMAKEYSTPKSPTFINGVLDSILADLKAKGLVRKEGKGLVE